MFRGDEVLYKNNVTWRPLDISEMFFKTKQWMKNPCFVQIKGQTKIAPYKRRITKVH